MNLTARDYFLSRLPETGEKRALYNRVITALSRHNLTMQALCEMSEKELIRVRGVGPASHDVIKAECRSYLYGKDEADT